MAANPDASTVKFGLVFEADTDGEFMVPISSDSAFNSRGNRYVPVSAGDGQPLLTETSRQVLSFVGARTVNFTKMYVEIGAAPGTSPNSIKFTLREDGADASPELAVTIGSGQTTGNASATVSITDGKKWGIEIVPNSDPVRSTFHITLLAGTDVVAETRIVILDGFRQEVPT